MTVNARIKYLILLLMFVTIALTSLSVMALYQVAFREKETDLRQMAQNQAKLISAVARFDNINSVDAHPEGAVAATISQIIDANLTPVRKDSSLDVIIAQRLPNKIVYLMRLNGPLSPPIKPDQLIQDLPMSLAINGQKGTTIYTNKDGEEILAAYDYIPELDVGVVTQKNLSEIRGPFIQVGLLLAGLATVTVILGSYFILRMMQPVIGELIDARNEAEKADIAKSNFLANMSHELRTPLNAIIGFSEIIKSNILPDIPGQAPRHIGYAADINKAGNHLLSVINDILDMSKIDANKMELSEGTIVLDQMVSQCLTLMKPLANEKNITIHYERKENCPEVLNGDNTRVKQMLINLISNAIKFSSRDQNIHVGVSTSPKGELLVSVSDKGLGIAQKDIPLVLSKFGQVNNSYIRDHQGTGLGLPLVKMLVESHQGKLVIESELNQGTRAILVFPNHRLPQENQSSKHDG
ncbi:MAG: ATP-binding protein [Alphaproteobacteria bacterium]|nr:ATP-binding protein [Alphaproteobacteria bacterium]